MADDRPVADPTQDLADLKRKFDDFRSTVLNRLTSRPTGTIEGFLLPTAPAGTLLLDGSTVNRLDYPGLWQWVIDHGLGGGAPFGNGDGSTTFVLPNFQGRVQRGIMPGGSPGQLIGSDLITLTVGQMPSHNHQIVSDGGHSGHVNSYTPGVALAGGGSSQVDNDYTGVGGTHSHGGVTGASGNYDQVDVRQATYAVNWVIYT